MSERRLLSDLDSASLPVPNLCSNWNPLENQQLKKEHEEEIVKERLAKVRLLFFFFNMMV